MRRTAAIVAAALTVLLAAELTARWLEPALIEPDKISALVDDKRAQIDRLASGPPIDVVLAGSSQVVWGMDPAVIAAETGQSVYNAGLFGATPIIHEEWLLETVLPKLRPSTVIVGLTSSDFNDNGWLANRFVDEWRERQSPTLRDRIGSLAGGDWSALVRVRSHIREPRTAVKAVRDRLAGRRAGRAIVHPDANGFRADLAGAVFDDSPGDRRRHQELVEDFVIGPRESAALDRLIRRLQARQVQVLLVAMPVHPTFVASHPRGQADFDRFQAALVATGRRLGVPVVDGLTGNVGDELFTDQSHLNGRGTGVLSSLVGEQAVTLGAVPVPAASPGTSPAAGAGPDPAALSSPVTAPPVTLGLPGVEAPATPALVP